VIKLLPESLKYLKFGEAFAILLDNLPSKLEYLHCEKFFDTNVNLPSGLKFLVTHKKFNNFPLSLVGLKCHKRVNLPYLPNLRHLFLLSNKQILNFPLSKTVKFLKIKRNNNIPHHIKFVNLF